MNQKQLDELQIVIAGCINNNRVAQEKLYNMFYPKMVKTAIRYSVDMHQAEDILSMSFLKCFQSIDKYAFNGSFEGWLRKIVIRTALDSIRVSKKHNHNYNVVPLDNDDLIGVNDNDVAHYDQLIQLVNTLPKMAKDVFNLSVMEGYPHKQIAAMLGISEGTSKWYLSEGRKTLRAKIKQLK
jgi:RNA polymerase sigma factor (sigma-70 family)